VARLTKGGIERDMPPLSLYVHIPFCHRRCPYCSFYHVRPDGDAEGAFVEALVAEARATIAELPSPVVFRTVYFGGGTPTILAESSWARIFESLESYLTEATEEVTCELNPEDAGDHMLAALAARGVNRLSVGIQSMDGDAQRLLRRCSPETNREAIKLAFRHFDNVSFDLLLGVPGRTARSMKQTLDELVDYRPHHFSVYCLEPGGDLGGEVADFFDAVDVDASADEYLVVCERLAGEGYRHYEVSNFARPGFDSLHNRAYWDGGDYVGLGPAAHSFVGGYRYHNPPSIETYLRFANGDLRPQDYRIVDDSRAAEAEVERLMLALRSDRGFPVESLRCPPGAKDAILNEGLAQVKDGLLRLTDRGYLLLNEIVLRLTAQ